MRTGRRTHLVATALSSLCTLATSARAASDPLACEDGAPSGHALEAWRNAAAKGLESGAVSEPALRTRLAACFPHEAPSCLGTLKGYLHRSDTAPPEMDLVIEDAPQKQPPRELLRPGATGLDYVVPSDIEAVAAQRGWTAVRYKTRQGGGFDPASPSFLLLYVPGARVDPPVTFDRWLNIALPADAGAEALTPLPQAKVPVATDYASELTGGPRLPRIFTMVTLEPPAHGTKPTVYFQKFHRSELGSPSFTPESNAEVATCVGCHPNGLRAISPLGYHVHASEAQLPEATWNAVKSLNTAMVVAAGGGTVSWRDIKVDADGDTEPLLKPAVRGPLLGPKEPLNGKSRTKAFIMGDDGKAGCYAFRPRIDVTDIYGRAPGATSVFKLAASPQIRWEKVRDAMSCERCHDGGSRGALNDLTDPTLVDFKILVDQAMPYGAHLDPLDLGSATAAPHDDLTPDERIALANCLAVEFRLEQGELAKWLTRERCE